MTDLIKAVEDSREKATKIALDSVSDLLGSSEVEIRDKILSKMAEQKEFFPLGWYDPPFGGVGILFGDAPYNRLQFETLRDQKFLPNKDNIFNKESVAMVYLSPVHLETGMIGDVGFTVYNGSDENIKKHVRKCYDLLTEVAEHIQMGMSFGDIYAYAINIFENREYKTIAWMSTSVYKATNDQKLKINLGHTVPGSFRELSLGDSFEEIKESIRSKRIFINEGEEFIIPQDCAFTLETRLTDKDRVLPNVFFHFIITFSGGEKKILANFEDIFIKTGMDYML